MNQSFMKALIPFFWMILTNEIVISKMTQRTNGIINRYPFKTFLYLMYKNIKNVIIDEM